MNILILQNPGNYSRPKLASFEVAFKSLGHACGHVELEEIARAAEDGTAAPILQEIHSQVRQGVFEALLCYSMNHLRLPSVTIDGTVGDFATLLGVPIVQYWPDPLLESSDYGAYVLWKNAPDRLGHPNAVHLVKEQPAADELTEFFGLPNVHALPLCVDVDEFRPLDISRDVDVIFVGGCDGGPADPLVLDDLPAYDAVIRRQLEAARPRVGELAALLPFPEAYRGQIRDTVAEVFDRKAADPSLSFWPLLKQVSAARNAPGVLTALRGCPEIYHQFRELILKAHDIPRGLIVGAVAERCNTVTLGSDAWKQWRVNHQGWATAAEQAQWYSRAKIGLNYTLAWDQAGVNFKVFEITACRTLCLTNYREQLEELYDLDRELVVYRSHEELLDKLDFYLRHDAERERIAAAGYRRTLAHHTFENRARTVVEAIERASSTASRAEPVGV